MAKGLRFFGTDYNNQAFGATVTVSSADTKKDFIFDGLIATRWISSGENTDGDAVSIEVDYGTNRTIDSLYIYNTNIDDIAYFYWNGSSYIELTATNATITKSADGAYIFVKFNASVATQKVNLTGSNTIVTNQEKSVTLFYSYLELGQFEYFPEFKPGNKAFQSNFRTTDGRKFIIERGGNFEATITFKSHVNQNDIDLFRTLLDRKENFYIWPCGGDVSIFKYSFAPFRFQDIYKVGIVGGNASSYTKGYYRAGLNDKIKIEEVV